MMEYEIEKRHGYQPTSNINNSSNNSGDQDMKDSGSKSSTNLSSKISIMKLKLGDILINDNLSKLEEHCLFLLSLFDISFSFYQCVSLIQFYLSSISIDHENNKNNNDLRLDNDNKHFDDFSSSDSDSDSDDSDEDEKMNENSNNSIQNFNFEKMTRNNKLKLNYSSIKNELLKDDKMEYLSKLSSSIIHSLIQKTLIKPTSSSTSSNNQTSNMTFFIENDVKIYIQNNHLNQNKKKEMVDIFYQNIFSRFDLLHQLSIISSNINNQNNIEKEEDEEDEEEEDEEGSEIYILYLLDEIYTINSSLFQSSISNNNQNNNKTLQLSNLLPIQLLTYFEKLILNFDILLTRFSIVEIICIFENLLELKTEIISMNNFDQIYTNNNKDRYGDDNKYDLIEGISKYYELIIRNYLSNLYLEIILLQKKNNNYSMKNNDEIHFNYESNIIIILELYQNIINNTDNNHINNHQIINNNEMNNTIQEFLSKFNFHLKIDKKVKYSFISKLINNYSNNAKFTQFSLFNIIFNISSVLIDYCSLKNQNQNDNQNQFLEMNKKMLTKILKFHSKFMLNSSSTIIIESLKEILSYTNYLISIDNNDDQQQNQKNKIEILISICLFYFNQFYENNNNNNNYNLIQQSSKQKTKLIKRFSSNEILYKVSNQLSQYFISNLNDKISSQFYSFLSIYFYKNFMLNQYNNTSNIINSNNSKELIDDSITSLSISPCYLFQFSQLILSFYKIFLPIQSKKIITNQENEQDIENDNLINLISTSQPFYQMIISFYDQIIDTNNTNISNEDQSNFNNHHQSQTSFDLSKFYKLDIVNELQFSLKSLKLIKLSSSSSNNTTSYETNTNNNDNNNPSSMNQYEVNEMIDENLSFLIQYYTEIDHKVDYQDNNNDNNNEKRGRYETIEEVMNELISHRELIFDQLFSNFQISQLNKKRLMERKIDPSSSSSLEEVEGDGVSNIIQSSYSLFLSHQLLSNHHHGNYYFIN